MSNADCLDPTDPEQPYDEALDPFLRAFIHLTFRETRRETPDAQWLDLITEDTPAAVASMLHAKAHYSVRWDKPFRDVLSFGLDEPCNEPYWSPDLAARDNLLLFGSMDWATIYLTWNAARAQLLLCTEEQVVSEYASLEGFVSEGIEALLHEPPEDETERRDATEMLQAYREHVAAWVHKLQVRAAACRDAAAKVQEAMNALDLDSDGAEAALDELALAEARVGERLSALDRALFRSKNALRELDEERAWR